MNIQKSIHVCIATLFFLSLFLFHTVGQNIYSVDSLKKVIVAAKSDSNLVKAYLDIGDLYKYNNIDTTLYYYRKALKLADKLKLPNYLAESLKAIGSAFYSQSDYDSALYYYDRALKISKKIDNKKILAKLFMNYGNIYIKRGIYDKALDYELAALKLYEEVGDKAAYAGCLNNIGNIYSYQRNHKKALEYYLQALEIKTEIGDKKGKALLYGNIGNLYYDLGELDKALEYSLKSVQLYKELGDKNGIARIYDIIGSIFTKKRNYSVGLEYFKKALKLNEETGYKRGIIFVLLDIGDLYNRTGQYNKALTYELRALRMALETGELNLQKIAYERIADSYKGMGDYKSALLYREKWFQVHDSIFNIEKTNAIAEAEARFQSEKQEQQIKLQQAELEKSKAELARVEAVKKQQEIQRDLFIVAFGLMIILAATIFYFYRQKKKDNALLVEQQRKIYAINKELTEKNKKLQATLETLKQAQQQLVQSEKMASLGMLSAGIAHEINNPINFVYAGINSLLRDFEDIKPVVEEINKITPETDNLKEMIKKIEHLKSENYFDEALKAIPQIISDIKLGADRTAEIVRSLRSFSRSDSSEMQPFNIHEGLDTALLLLKNKYKKNIEIIKKYTPDIPHINCHPGKINQIFLNILANAIDAIEGTGKIWITTWCEGDYIKVSVKDTGCGMNEETKQKIFDPFFTTKEVGKGTGLGMSITYGIIQEHKGKIDIISEPGKGTEIIIALPINHNKSANS